MFETDPGSRVGVWMAIVGNRGEDGLSERSRGWSAHEMCWVGPRAGE
ncbi:hypothetical protein THIX_60803 [Thiomonas sp. X19]|nr:hypothetical protein THIX_60803 [Thiomonas sp. X19]